MGSSDSDDFQQLNDLQEIKNVEPEQNQKLVIENQMDIFSKIGPSDITHIVSDPPTQPILKNYPQSKFGKEWRQFRPEWFKSYPWLEYSVLDNACYCFPCRFFSHNSDNSPFYKIGFKNWKKALDKNAGIKGHNKSCIHKTCMTKWEGYKNSKKTKSILTTLNEANLSLIKENRYYISVISEILLFTACQNIAQRGDDEGSESLNRGNFLELLELCARRDARFKAKIDILPKNAKYTHHTIQNDLFYVMSKLVLETIAKEVKEAKYFAILADETKDVSKTEQLSIMVRYYHNNIMNERFLGYVPCNELNAKALFDYINKTLSDCGINIKNCIAQTYDGANVMSGKQNAVRSTVHTKFIELQNKLLPKKKIMELKRICETRWICQISACIAVKKTFPVILLLLHQISLESKSEKEMEAKSLLFHINFEFIFCLYLFCDTFSEIKIVLDYLQKPDSDLGSSCLLVESLINYLMEFRNTSNKFEDLLTEVELCAQKNNIQLPNETVKETRIRKLPKQFSSYITEVTTSESRKISNNNDIKTMIFFPVLDRMVSELNRRFSDHSEILTGISALIPKCDTFLNFTNIKPLAEHYKLDIESLESELTLITKLIKRHEAENAFSEMYILCIISIIIPPSSAGVKRTFSSLRQIKNYMRNKMTNKRLSNIAILSIEKKIAKNLDLEVVVDKFAAIHKNRRILLT
ncbi:zinc finger MYM-type protein 1-like [Daktulosphaira vitifoliae]|uniref:zinc finger MYM-type protein 1-like n=1 Tax=Daktulosphaira vitifoliae TaxID=58002 RepID=UPI0021A9D07C|nr:zinc finger MYM-type protein 1-like [Daktulosphaira vitifoliae]